MKTKNIALLAACVAGVAVTSGCSSMPVNFLASTKPVAPGGYTVVAEQVSGTDHQVLFMGGIGAAKLGSSQKRAEADALKQAPGADALVDVAIDYERKNLGVAQFLTTRVTGTAVKTK